MTYTDNFTEQAMTKELDYLNERVWAVEHLYDEAKTELTARNLELKAQQKTIDLLSLRLDKVMEYIKCQ